MQALFPEEYQPEEETTEPIFNRSAVSLLVRALLSIVVVGAVVSGVVTVSMSNQNKYDYAISHPQVDYVAPAPVRITDDRLSKLIREETLRALGVAEFQEILYDAPDNLLGELQTIKPLNPGADDGEFAVHFTAEPEMGVWTQQQANDAAVFIMRAAGPDHPEITGVSAMLSTWDYVNNETHDFMTERAGREVLGALQ